MISSELPEILNLADRIIVIAKGEITHIFEETISIKESDILSKCINQ